MKEKVLFREKIVDNMLRVTVHYERSLNEDENNSNLTSKKNDVKEKLSGLNLLSEDMPGKGNPNFIYSLSLSFEDKYYPIWLQIQFSDEVTTENKVEGHVEYELERLKRGGTEPDDMRKTFPSYLKHECGEDEDFHDVNIIKRILEMRLKVCLVQ